MKCACMKNAVRGPKFPMLGAYVNYSISIRGVERMRIERCCSRYLSQHGEDECVPSPFSQFCHWS